jgi:hypothetical protein
MTAKSQVTLLITNSIDYLADLLVAQLGSDRVFRYNTDLWRDYAFYFSPAGIEVSDPTGRSIADSDIAKVYRRSSMRGSVLFPQMKLTDLERYAEEEVYAAWADLFNIFWHQGKIVPDDHGRRACQNVDAVNRDAVGFSVGDEQKLAHRIDCYADRNFASAAIGSARQRRERAATAIDPICADVVGFEVCKIDELSRRMDRDRGRAFAGRIRRPRNRLEHSAVDPICPDIRSTIGDVGKTARRLDRQSQGFFA